MNPARSLAPAVVSGTLASLWIYLIAPVLGAVADIAFVHLTRRDVVRHKIVADIVDAYEVAEGRAGSTQ